jgi:hypothetical protein
MDCATAIRTYIEKRLKVVKGDKDAPKWKKEALDYLEQMRGACPEAWYMAVRDPVEYYLSYREQDPAKAPQVLESTRVHKPDDYYTITRNPPFTGYVPYVLEWTPALTSVTNLELNKPYRIQCAAPRSVRF